MHSNACGTGVIYLRDVWSFARSCGINNAVDKLTILQYTQARVVLTTLLTLEVITLSVKLLATGLSLLHLIPVSRRVRPSILSNMNFVFTEDVYGLLECQLSNNCSAISELPVKISTQFSAIRNKTLEISQLSYQV